jgi:lipoprotein signal peptidase
MSKIPNSFITMLMILSAGCALSAILQMRNWLYIPASLFAAGAASLFLNNSRKNKEEE